MNLPIFPKAVGKLRRKKAALLKSKLNICAVFFDLRGRTTK